MSVYLHYLSPKSRQYFHRAICMSGVMCTESDFQVEPEEKARKLARLLGYRGTSDNDVLETLLKASARSLIRLQNHVASQQEEGDPLQFLFRPVIEQDVFKDTIITQSPERILKSFDSLRLPIMLGTVCSEGVLAFVENKNNLSKYNKHVSWLVPRFMEIRDEIERKTIGDQIKQFYLGNQDIGSDTTNETCNLMTDLTFSVMSNLSSELIAKYQPNVKQYCYLFSFIGRCNITKTVLNVKNVDGAAHTDDIFNLFGFAN
uniref:carboxylesterase n=2 Tax=Culex pipiens TaxID=7175 RepID=A0A8D8ND92_CULPI